MFGFLYRGMMRGGELDELPRRRGPGIIYDPQEGAFMAPQSDTDDVGHAPWLQRGEVPGAAPAAAAEPTDGLSVADEARALAKPPTR